MSKEKKTSDPTSLPHIPDHIEKSLLKDLKEKGLPFNQISFLQLCDDKVAIYGVPRSKTRRALQKHYVRLKNRSPQSYRSLLLKYDIVPGPFTFQRLKETESPIKSATKQPVKKPTINEPTPAPTDEESIEETSNIDNEELSI